MGDKIFKIIGGHSYETYIEKYGYLFNKNKLHCHENKDELKDNKKYWLIENKYYEISKFTHKGLIAFIISCIVFFIAFALAGTLIIVNAVNRKVPSHFNDIDINVINKEEKLNSTVSYYTLTLKDYLVVNQKIDARASNLKCDNDNYTFTVDNFTYSPNDKSVLFMARLVRKEEPENLNESITNIHCSFDVTLDCKDESNIIWSENINNFKVKYSFDDEKNYSINVIVNNGEYTGSDFIISAGEANVKILPNYGYNLPKEVIVKGADSSYDNVTGNIKLSNPVSDVMINASCELKTFNITGEITNGSIPSDLTITPLEVERLIQITPDSGYNYPISINVTGAQNQYDSKTGIIRLSNATSDVKINASCVGNQYRIVTNITNGSYTGDYLIYGGNEATVTLIPNLNCVLPKEIEVTNAIYEYDNETGVINLSNPTGEVTINANCDLIDFETCSFEYLNRKCVELENNEITLKEFTNSFMKDGIVLENEKEFLGLEKNIKLNGLNHVIRVIGVCQDKISNEKTAALTFEFKTLISDESGNGITKKWDDTNNYDYINSVINKYLNEELVTELPLELSSIIKTVNKDVAIYNDETKQYEINNYSTKMFLLTVGELGNESTHSIENEIVYQFYDDLVVETVPSKIKADYKGINSQYFLRSPVTVDGLNLSFCIDTNGDLESNSVKNFATISPAFAI